MLLIMVLLTIKMATCNFNNKASHTQLNALQHCLNVYDIDILYLQELSIEDFSKFIIKSLCECRNRQLGTAILQKIVYPLKESKCCQMVEECLVFTIILIS